MESKYGDREKLTAASSKKDGTDDAASLTPRMAGCKVKDDAPNGEREMHSRSASGIVAEAKSSGTGHRSSDGSSKSDAKEVATQSHLSNALPKSGSGLFSSSLIEKPKLSEEQILSIQDEKVELEFEESLHKPNNGEIVVSHDPQAQKILAGFKM